MSAPVILEVAANGITTRTQNPAVPREPKEIAEDALACFAAGAAIVHTHTHEPALPPAEGAALYLEAYRPVLAERPDALLYPTVAPGRTIEERYGHTALLAEAGAIRCGGARHRLGEPRRRAARRLAHADGLRLHEQPERHPLHGEVCREHRLGPSVAVFEPGFLRVVLAAEKRGALPPGTLVKLYFSAGGYLGGGEPIFGAPPIREALEHVSRDAAGLAAAVGGGRDRRLAARLGDRAPRARARRTPARRPRGFLHREGRTWTRCSARVRCANESAGRSRRARRPRTCSGSARA